MTTSPAWDEIALRLVLTIVAGTLIGINRGEHGRPAGLRTTLLVCLAASITMIQTNLLLGTAGRGPDSYVSLDLMRLPLGILSGMGFIGGGVILKRDNLILGVTTAATLWFVTVIGLCLGGGQLALGAIALVLGLVVLRGLKWAELRLPQDRRATLIATIGPGGPSADEVCRRFRSAGYEILSLGLTLDNDGGRCEVRCEMQWREPATEVNRPPGLEELAASDGVSRVTWIPKACPPAWVEAPGSDPCSAHGRGLSWATAPRGRGVGPRNGAEMDGSGSRCPHRRRSCSSTTTTRSSSRCAPSWRPRATRS